MWLHWKKTKPQILVHILVARKLREDSDEHTSQGTVENPPWVSEFRCEIRGLGGEKDIKWGRNVKQRERKSLAVKNSSNWQGCTQRWETEKLRKVIYIYMPHMCRISMSHWHSDFLNFWLLKKLIWSQLLPPPHKQTMINPLTSTQNWRQWKAEAFLTWLKMTPSWV